MTYCGMMGVESASLISYLQAVPGVTPIKAGANPATWMLEVTGGSAATAVTAADADFPELYKVLPQPSTVAIEYESLMCSDSGQNGSG